MICLDIRNISAVKRLYNRRRLEHLGERICREERGNEGVEVSLLFCDDPFIQELNARFRGKNEPTDVLSFQQEAPLHTARTLLGDIVISLETVQRFCGDDRKAMQQEMMLLYCHGLLHLLGYTHAKRADRKRMQEKQAYYLDTGIENVWR